MSFNNNYLLITDISHEMLEESDKYVQKPDRLEFENKNNFIGKRRRRGFESME